MDAVTSLIDLAKGFGTSAPVIGLLLWLYWNERKERGDLGGKVYTMLGQQYDDAAKRKELWDAQAKVIDGQTGAIRDLTREVQGARSDIQRIRP